MTTVQLFDLWLKAGGTALGLSLLSPQITTITGEELFPPGLPREALFASLPQGGTREFWVQEEAGLGKAPRRAKVVFGVYVEEVKEKQTNGT